MPQFFDSTASFPMKSKRREYASGGRVAGGRVGLKMVSGFNQLINQLRKEERKENVLLLLNQDVQVELKL